ncbi:alpha/beta hydrolase [Glacieibacterium megasporae]|uniref:alpha/beta hydrolase n=1 Tax=Glacieibacterium megasporae TaxID=2835787 RepID=UPI001C1E72A5|nr:alpha/beta hydrolase [Polymorphobacter megasporae]UAJ10615.1 alpha/beta hydrolase [Polymorphobacter megasporae]
MNDVIELLGSPLKAAIDRRTILLGMCAVGLLSGAASGMPAPKLSSRIFSTVRHTTHYLEIGPAGGPLMIFLHGWPELGLIWRAQMDAFAADGWRCVAPDMRGYGGSSIPEAIDAYTYEHIIQDMAELHDHLGGKPAIWVGHDWGSVIASSLVAHQPARSRGAVLISVPYFPDANALPTIVPLVDRTIYPADQYPDGQWDYYRYYTKHFKSAVADLDADKAASLASIFRKGDPASVGKPSPNAMVTRKGGRFGSAHRAPPTRPDADLWPSADFDALVQAFNAHGFRGPCAWYMNDDANIAYARMAPSGGRILQPVLYVNGDLDAINTIKGNHSGDPMRAACADLVVTSLVGAHWLPLERKAELIQVIRAWLGQKALRPVAA